MRAGRANGVAAPIRMMVEMSCRTERRKKAAKSARFLSTSAVSFVRRLMIRPSVWVWKKDIGVLQRGDSGQG